MAPSSTPHNDAPETKSPIFDGGGDKQWMIHLPSVGTNRMD